MTFNHNWCGDIAPEVQLSPKKLTVIAGPCMLESKELGFAVAKHMKSLCDELGLQYVFKSSYDKANRTSGNTMRGPGLEQGLSWLAEIREHFRVPVLTDVHTPTQFLLFSATRNNSSKRVLTLRKRFKSKRDNTHRPSNSLLALMRLLPKETLRSCSVSAVRRLVITT
jgi:hypothetical protein